MGNILLKIVPDRVLIIVALLTLFGCTNSYSPSLGPISSTKKISTPTVSSTPIHSGPRFPRLGMWWPDGWHQPLPDIARYDWVILGNWQTQFIDQLRGINPNIVLLTSTDACELHYDPNDLTSNQDLLKIPYQWFLTQVGTSLNADVDSVQTSLPVKALTADNGEKVIDLFVPGDTALIDNESVYIQEVDKFKNMLTVQRGYVRPASSHKAGTRIAAHISTWPNTWMLNVSTLSPKSILDPAFGPEIWPEYNAHIGKQLLNDPRWSGILVDRSDTDQSRYIDNSSIRSIDPDQSNQLLSDYSAFDAAWKDGLRLYLDKLRQAIGPQSIIMLNWGVVYYQDVNGNNFEGFPDDSGGLGNNPWHNMVFGPTAHGSYFDWITYALQPNITMIETYEDNRVPSDTYDNRCTQPDFQPNYRKMRFGLTTALLNDGYFSYEMNTAGHGSLCLMWFDEYDNSGAGRGYLGYPISQAQIQVGLLDVWRRDYENGIVLVNATSEPVVISLGGPFRKIRGTQDPKVNDGSLITQVTLQAKDGIILLKP
jgi:hypothetical protein